MANSIKIKGPSKWTYLGECESGDIIKIPDQYNDVMVRSIFPKGQSLVFNVGFTESNTIRQDLGFYYTDAAYGSGACVAWASSHSIQLYQPMYAGSATTFTEIKIYAK